MVGPVVYEASVPFFVKALKNQLKLLQRGKEWCNEHDYDESRLTAATLATDMSVCGRFFICVTSFFNHSFEMC